jgi:mRNA interferase RelE/StbE
MNEAEYEIVIVRSAQKEIRSLDATVRVRILKAIRSLGSDPRPPGNRKLQASSNSWRIRVGDYRVVYSIDDQERQIEIFATRHGSKAYE